MRLLTIQQPHYFPWLGYFEQIRVSDEFLLLDDVQWTRQGRQHRTPLEKSTGERRWLTLPVNGHGHREKTIREMRLAHELPWAKNQWASIQSLYSKKPYFHSQLEPLVRPWFEKADQFKFLIDALESSLNLVCEELSLASHFARASNWNISTHKTERLVDLCEMLDADSYYSSLGSTRYLDLSCFRAKNIRVYTQHWNAPESLSNLSILHGLATVSMTELKMAMEPKSWGPFAAKQQVLPLEIWSSD